jgi:hypothetical protein
MAVRLAEMWDRLLGYLGLGWLGVRQKRKAEQAADSVLPRTNDADPRSQRESGITDPPEAK